MSEKIFLLALIPHTVLLVWGIRKIKFAGLPVAMLCAAAMITVWGILYLSFCLVIFEPDPALALAPVPYTLDVPSEWLLRYAAEVFGWFIGLLYFWVCWGIARFSPTRTSYAT